MFLLRIFIFILLSQIVICEVAIAQNLSFGLQYSHELQEGISKTYKYHKFDPVLFPDQGHEHFMTDPYSVSAEHQTILSLTAEYKIIEGLRCGIKLPFVTNTRISENDLFNERFKGFGDIEINAGYILLTNKSKVTHNVLYQLEGVMVVGIPTGAFDLTTEEGEIEPQIQPGTGKQNYKGQLVVKAKWMNWQINSNLSYEIFEPNLYGYEFGDRIEASVSVSPKLSLDEIQIWPEVGLTRADWKSDIMNGRFLANELEAGEDTGGTFWTVNMGTTFIVQPFHISLFYNKIILEDYIGQQMFKQGQVELQLRYTILRNE